jgi:filamentous hemagglutinin family protein
MKTKNVLWLYLIGWLVFLRAIPNARANPQGLSVQSGTAGATTSGSQLTVNVSQTAVLNWQSFNINLGETTTFQQPSASSVVVNQIGGLNPSQILGSLHANGMVILENKSGFYFGQNSFVKVGGLVVSTAAATPQEFTTGASWQFNGPPPQASIVNYGQLQAARGGSIFLIGENLQNKGTIVAPGGSIGLYGSQSVLVSERPDGRGLTAATILPSGSIDNAGRLIADAGTIALNAKTVNQDGLVQADSVRQQNGVIELVASDAISLGDNSVIAANGGKIGSSDAGQITIQSGATFTDSCPSQISAAGGTQGGNGGNVEISAPQMTGINSQINGHADAGFTGGKLVIDPTTINLTTSGTGSAGSGSVGSGAAPTTLNLNVNSAFIGFSQIDLQATGNILLAANTTWNLATSTGISTPGSQLILEAGNSINIGNGASIVGGSGWSLTLEAGRNFSSPVANAVTSGTGSIVLSGTGALQTSDGSMTLLAGNSITLGSGSVTTTGGGSISATAVGGSVNAGTGQNGYDFYPGTSQSSPGFYQVAPNLSGISTANGGNVTITAGQDIVSYLPVSGGTQTDAGSGTFGAAAGNVTLTAGANIIGHYVVANGTGTINAANDAGSSSLDIVKNGKDAAGFVPTLLALSLVSGSWNVNAGQNINLQEVRNPNGVFNNRGLGSSTTKNYFDYAADDSVSLVAGNSVNLLGTSLPRNNDDTFDENIPCIYPPSLSVTAGAGGVTLGADVILFPSPQGQLSINTSGSFIGTQSGDLSELVLSDSGKTQYQTAGDFGISDYAAVPVHLNDYTPLQINVVGDMDNILVSSPKVAEIAVGGSMNNTRFNGQNLHAGDVTTITVKGDILNRNDFTTYTIGSTPGDFAPNFSVFNLVYPPLSGTLASLPTLFQYNAASMQLTFQGRMTGDQEAALLNLRVEVLDGFGNPVLDGNGNVVTVPAQFISAAAVTALFNNSQNIPLNPNSGYLIGGTGSLDITARNLDLGATAGIVSEGPGLNPALANYFTTGANINVNLSGNLDMFSTTISSLNGGNISVNAGGYANIGSTYFSGDDSVARGIFTVAKSDVSVIAGGDIDVNGSRIAAYDGGNIFVESKTGNIDAGTGGVGSTSVEEILVDPVTRQIESFEPTIPGSGILATTFPPSLDPGFPTSKNTVGNILVETPEGSITANTGGIVQLPLNGVNVGAGTVSLIAGSKDASGNVLYAGNIDVSDSGVIGSTVDLEATGNITGVVLARTHVDINAVQNVNVTAVSGGDAQISAGDSLQGSVFAIGSITAGAGSIGASLLSQNVTTTGTVTSSQIGFAPGTVANSTSSALQNDETARRIASTDQATGDGSGDGSTNAFRGKLPRLTKTTGRVTMILPNTP